MKRLATVALSATLMLGLSSAQAAEEKYVTIGTGGQTGVYYVVGQSICKLVNREQSKYGIKCTAPSTGGSVANLNAIRAGEQDMGVAQSDQQYNALKGEGEFKAAGPFKELRSVFALHPESFTVVARKDSGINNFCWQPPVGIKVTSSKRAIIIHTPAISFPVCKGTHSTRSAAAICKHCCGVVSW